MSERARLVSGLLYAGSLTAALSLACSSSDRSPPPGLGPNVGIAQASNILVGPCDTGEVRDCSITLSEHAGVLNCYHGRQACVEGDWTSCGNGELSSMPAMGMSKASPPGLRLLALSGADTCDSNPCDPTCLQLERQPDAGANTSVLEGDPSSFTWQTGSLQSFPSGLVKKGLIEPCATGSDCQFNTRCQYPVSPSCSHNKCAVGGTLEASCDPCVADICEVDPTCCPQPATVDPVCQHDLCLEGEALSESCDSCAQLICADNPSCCTDSWDASCVAAVASVCGASCTCRAGELEYAGSCYFHEEADENWEDARESCQERGDGWDLVSLGDEAENDFVVDNVIDNSETWIGFTDGNGIGTGGEWYWTNGDPALPWDESDGNGVSGEVTVVDWGVDWSYRDVDSDPGASWNELSYDDGSWSTGPAQLGFGDGDEATSITRDGPSYYFRHVVNLTATPSAAQLEVLFDDGFVAYVNGSEVARDNANDASHDAYASSGSSDDEVFSSAIDTSPFVVGDNLIAVVVKNRSRNNSDVSFDLRLRATFAEPKPVNYGDDWSHHVTGTDPGSNWNQLSYDDSGWPTGPAQLGFGDSDEATSFPKTGPSYYFRREFTLSETLSGATLSVLFDDGFVAYVNGVEVDRENVSSTDHSAYASNDSSDDEIETQAISTAPFVVGTNVLAVVVKNHSSGSSDISFDAELEVTLSSAGIYQNFASSEPDEDEPCARYQSNRVGTWGDKRCNKKFDSVCEGPPKQMTGGSAAPTTGAWTAVDFGSDWRYQSDGSDPGSSWTSLAYDDAGWFSGSGQLGFGDGDEATSFSANNPSYYFRHVVNLPSEISDATLDMVYDDGFVTYVNGVELSRRNVLSTSHGSYASSTSGDNETLSVPVDASPFVVGDNVIAVQVKNRSNSSSDVSFDLKLRVTLCGPSGCPAAPEWSQACVDLVGSVCNAQCDDGDPLETTGQCVPWYPGETDSSCGGADLALGVPCADSIPVCNHGTVTAPAGVRLVHFPGNSTQYPNCEPDQTHPQMYECFTDAEIPPGECLNVTSCPNLSGNREIMVNPPGAQHVPECNCSDNWSLYSSNECGEPTCGGGSSVATLQKKAVDVIFVIDNSGSMQGEIAQVQQRINEDFASIIEDSGLDYQVVMMSRYGDISTSVGGSNYPICVSSPLGGHDCSDPINQGVQSNPPNFYHFSTDVQSRDSLCRILEGWDHADELASDSRSWTQQLPQGLQGVLRPDARKAFVVITDDDVDCNYGGYDFDDDNGVSSGQAVASAFDQALLSLSAEQFGSADDRNYVFHSIVAMSEFVPASEPWPSSEPIQTGQCSPGSEGPGTGYQALSVLTGGLRYPTCRNDDFDAIFQALAEDVIEGATVSCSVEIGSNEGSDPANTTVRFASDTQAEPVTFSRVDSEASCVDNAYYYEDASTITLCPSTCTVVQADTTGALAVDVGCQGGASYVQRELIESYESECSEDTTVQWSFFTYNTTTPGDSNVNFRLRSAQTEAELEAAVWMDLATAQASPDTQICAMAGPAPCPVDLYSVLGGSPAAHHPFVQVEVQLNPTSDGSLPSTIQGWQLSYSCPFDQ